MDLKDIDIARIGDVDLLNFIHNFKHKDKEFESIIKMLPTAVGYHSNKLRYMLKQIKDGKKPIVVYPGIENVDTSKLEYVGEVDDGAMWLE